MMFLLLSTPRKRVFSTVLLVALLGALPVRAGAEPVASDPFPYALKRNLDLPLLGFAVLSAAGSHQLPVQQVLNVNDRNNLSLSQLNILDRPFAGRYNAQAALRSDAAVYAAMGSAVATPLLPASLGFWNRSWTLGVLCLEANLTTYGLTETTKRWVARARPLAYPESTAPVSEWQQPDARASFFSGHSSLAACNAVFAATVWSDLNPKSKWTPWVWAGAVALPSYTAWQRVEAGKHFPTDVLVGLAVGAAVGRLVPVLHRAAQPRKLQPKPISLL